MKQTNAENPELLAAIRFLKKTAKENDTKIWGTLAELLSKPRSRRIAVNLSRISRLGEEGQIIAVPGKVLGAGMLRYPMTVAAFAFSKMAEEKIRNAKGTCLTLPELVKQNPKGSDVRIVG